jgi:hypothetical protein
LIFSLDARAESVHCRKVIFWAQVDSGQVGIYAVSKDVDSDFIRMPAKRGMPIPFLFREHPQAASAEIWNCQEEHSQ